MDPITGEHRFWFVVHAFQCCHYLCSCSEFDHFLFVLLQSSAANKKGLSKDDTYWKEINAAMALTNLAQGKDRLQGTASCIIQKSSHIAEVKTVKVPLVQQFWQSALCRPVAVLHRVFSQILMLRAEAGVIMAPFEMSSYF